MLRILTVGLMLVGCVSRFENRVNYTLNSSQSSTPGQAMISFEKVKLIPPAFEVSTVVVRQELMYTGHEGTTFYLLYREYANDVIRDGYRQELVYDLAESNEIFFGPWRVQVTSATNWKIDFVVLSDGGLSEAKPSKAKKKKKGGSPTKAGG